MIDLSTNKLREGMITAQSVYNSKGASYLTKGMELNTQYIERLKKIGISKVHVTSIDPTLRLLPPEDIVQEQTRVSAIHQVCNAFQDIEKKDSFNLDALNSASESIVLDLIDKRNNLVQITDIRLHDDYTFSHSVNVAILAAMLGSLCGLERRDLMKLTLGGLLHDIGKLIVPKSILNKPGSLSDKEFEIIRMHPEAGREKLLEINKVVDPSIIDITVQHHEHLDGKGYPKRLVGGQIHYFSRIIAIADVYDALTSERAYKRAYKAYTASKIMMKCSTGQFDEALLKLFFNNVALYPVGTILRTKLGYAIVKKVIFGQTGTPIVCVFADENARVFDTPFDVDLSKAPADSIECAIENYELYTLIFKLKIDPAMYLTEVTS